MIDTDEKVDARTVEEDMETRNNMTWLNNRVIELETEVNRLREGIKEALIYLMIEVGGAEQAAIDTLKEAWKND